MASSFEIEKAREDYKKTIAALHPSVEDMTAAQEFGERIQKIRKRLGFEVFDPEQLQFAQMKYLEIKLKQSSKSV